MSAVPHDRPGDRTISFFRDPYRFAARRNRQLGGRGFRTRLLLQKGAFLEGAQGVARLYEPDLFTRKLAIPPTTTLQLQGYGSVQRLDGPAHRQRKAVFLRVASPAASAAFGEVFAAELRHRLPAWEQRPRIVLLTEMEAALCVAACAWVGVPLTSGDLVRRTRDFHAMISGAGAADLRAMRGLWRRRRTQAWARHVIVRVRDGRLPAPEGSPLAAVAFLRGPSGAAVSEAIAAVELLNLIRPTVAVARFIAFAGLALHQHPDWRERMGEEAAREAFAQEVRRFYPFFPVVGGRALKPFQFAGHSFPIGAWAFADLHGANHDPDLWREPARFRPERFLTGEAGSDDVVAQGGGDPALSHRCPGERLTVESIKAALTVLACEVDYQVPPQDLRIPMHRAPTAPASGLVITSVRRRASP